MIQQPFHFAMLSHPGRVRNGNEDACAAVPHEGAFVVCDGMGGAAAGEVASSMAVATWLHVLHEGQDSRRDPQGSTGLLSQAVQAANQAVFEHSRTSAGLRGMGTTLTGLLVDSEAGGGQSRLSLVHVGDSRCYRWRDGVLSQLTLDHSLVEEQISLGMITALEAETHPLRNVITRAVGSQALIQPDIMWWTGNPGDLYLLATDGLTRELNDATIARLMRAGSAGEFAGEKAALNSLCNVLVDAANSAGGGDNITVLLVALS